MNKQRPTRAQILQIGKYLEENIVGRGDGLVEYKEPWTDDLIADKVGCPKSSVANMRLQIHGKLIQAAGEGNSGRLTAAEQRLAHLEAHVRILTTRYNGLCAATAQRGVDIRMLRVDDFNLPAPPPTNGGPK